MTVSPPQSDVDNESCIARLLDQAACLQQVSDTPKLDAQLLLAEVLGCSRASIVAHPERLVEGALRQRFSALLQRRQRGEPLAYILGRKGFWDFEVSVDARVLIPRPETELLVEKSLQCLAGRENEPLQLLDLGTGSGVMAIALARHSPTWQVTATDQSCASLALARDNARDLGVANIRFVQTSWLDAFSTGNFDLIVSNPPYVMENDPHLLQDGLTFEPRTALVAAEDGLASLRLIITQAPRYLRSGGWLLLEHGYDQGPAVTSLFEQAGCPKPRGWQDLAGLDRVTAGRFHP